MRNALEMYRNTKYNINTIKTKVGVDVLSDPLPAGQMHNFHSFSDLAVGGRLGTSSPTKKTGLPVGNPVYYFLYTQAVGAGFFS